MISCITLLFSDVPGDHGGHVRGHDQATLQQEAEIHLKLQVRVSKIQLMFKIFNQIGCASPESEGEKLRVKFSKSDKSIVFTLNNISFIPCNSYSRFCMFVFFSIKNIKH